MIKAEWGIKRTCQGCGVRFYDLCRAPISCPKCNTIFEAPTASKGRRRTVLEEKAPIIAIEALVLEGLELPETLESELEGEEELLEAEEDLAEDLGDMAEVGVDVEE